MNNHRSKTISETQKAINNLLLLNGQSSGSKDLGIMAIAIAQGDLILAIEKALVQFKKDTE